MLLKDIMTKNIITVKPTDSLKKVGEILKEKRISGIPVVNDQGDLTGIITLTDLIRMFESIHTWKQLEKRNAGLKLSEMIEQEKAQGIVRDYMTKNVLTLQADATLEEAMATMFTCSVHTFPIVSDGQLVGVIGKRDLIFACL
ncbi:CBS domain-containing protein [Candidatus Omnitrophota bacterium]